MADDQIAESGVDESLEAMEAAEDDGGVGDAKSSGTEFGL
jgi:hypothetical protein